MRRDLAVLLVCCVLFLTGRILAQPQYQWGHYHHWESQNTRVLSVIPAVNGYDLAGYHVCYDSQQEDSCYRWFHYRYGEDGGCTLWEEWPDSLIGMTCLPDGEGGFILGNDVRIVHRSASAETLWTYQHDVSEDCDWYLASRLPDGGYIFGGECYDEDYNIQSSLLCLGETGDFRWRQDSLGHRTENFLFDLLPLSNGELLTHGIYPLGSTDEYYIVKHNADGDSLDAIFLPGLIDQWVATPDGGFTTATWMHDRIEVLHYRESLALDWLYSYSAASNRRFPTASIALSPSGEMMLSYVDTSAIYPAVVHVLCLNLAGDSLWSESISARLVDSRPGWGVHLQPALDGGWLIKLGSSTSIGQTVQCCIFKLAPMNTVENAPPQVPAAFELHAAYPNPFNPATTLSFTVSRTAEITVELYDVTGRKVATLADGIHSAGTHAVTVDGNGLASGIYFARLNAESYSQTQKLMLVK